TGRTSRPESHGLERPTAARGIDAKDWQRRRVMQVRLKSLSVYFSPAIGSPITARAVHVGRIRACDAESLRVVVGRRARVQAGSSEGGKSSSAWRRSGSERAASPVLA